MLTCSHCKSINPQHHNFCQTCGRSLNHHVCHSCGGEVEIDAENCPQCHAVSGTYWWAIIELTANQDKSAVANSTVAVVDSDKPSVPIEIIGVATAAADEYLPDLDPVDDVWATPQISLVFEASDLHHPIDLERSPWDDEAPASEAAVQTLVGNAPMAEKIDGSTSSSDINIPEPPASTIYLDEKCRYRLLDPVAIQLLASNDTCQVRVIDRQPFCNSPLEMLMEQEPVTLGSTTAHRLPEEYRQWQFWNNYGIPKVAQAYIALQVSLPGTIPPIRDSWDKDGKTVTVLEDRSKWTKLADRWSDPQVPPSQIIYWLDFTLKLWVALEPWQMRQSLLEIGNLLLDEDGIVCLQQLYPEQIEPKLKLANLAILWQSLFDRAGQDYPALATLLQAMKTGELERVEEVRSRLQQIAYELEPKQLSAPLESAELSAPHDAPTVAIDRRLVDLQEAAATHTGKKRDHNEDCFGIVTQIDREYSPRGQTISAKGLYILCDGMGGHAGGEIASAMTVDLLRDYFAVHWGDALPDEQIIREGIVATNEAVFDINQKNAASGSGRMGTTLVLVLVQDRNIAIAHVGDSRCYGITPTQGLIQLTLDHEVGQQQILRGVDPDIAYGRPDSYQLTQAIGPRDRNYIAPEIRFFELQEDTLLLIASDGLTDNQLLENHWLTNVAPLLSSNANLQNGVDRLIDFANEYNGHDNITALVVRAKLG
jgi:protein phosphatase